MLLEEGRQQAKGEFSMFPAPNYIWICENCGEKSTAHQDKKFFQFNEVSRKCPKCGGKMVGNPIVHRGPFPESPYKKY